jgi:hypothetical protein
MASVAIGFSFSRRRSHVGTLDNLFSGGIRRAIPMTAPDGKAFVNISESTAPFHLNGGAYAVLAILAPAPPPHPNGKAKLQKLGPDGQTYNSVSSTTDFAATGSATVYLPAGSYRFTVADMNVLRTTVTPA